VSAAIALALGLSLHQIHRRVDRVIDSVFFRQRHQDELALQRFARDVAFITDRDVVLERARETLQEHAHAATVEFALDEGRGRYGNVGENDPALVALRASHDVVDLHVVRTALAGEFAFPMIARGKLVGALVLGAKWSGEPYAPDESLAIAQLAHGVGVTLDVLAANGHATRDGLLEAMQAMSADMAALASDVRAIRQRLGGQ
jgi:hypothetical protein